VFTFVEAPLFTKLVGEYLTDGENAALQQASPRIRNSGTSSLGPVVSGRSDGGHADAESAAACA
jgi:hypothetical protein